MIGAAQPFETFGVRISENEGMKLTGHEIDLIYHGYDIISEEDL
jgi:hypothetical protein